MRARVHGYVTYVVRDLSIGRWQELFITFPVTRDVT